MTGTPDEEEDTTPLRVPHEDRRVITQPYDLSVETLIRQIDDAALVLESEIQRPYMWDEKKASGLIESLLLNVPIPVCYFAEDTSGQYEVVDGHQRLGSLHRFLAGSYRLSALKTLTELNGLNFAELPSRDKRTIRTRTIRCIVLTQDSNPEVKFDVFERLNTGAVALSAQELRNCVYRGSLNDLLKELASAPKLRGVVGQGYSKRLRDRELILRFLALRQRIEDYRPPLRQYLNEFAEKHRRADPETIESMRIAFLSALDKVHFIFGKDSFKRRDQAGVWRDRAVNRAIYDAQMVNFDLLTLEQMESKEASIRDAFDRLLGNPKFQGAVQGATADRTRFLDRIALLSGALASVGLDNGLQERAVRAASVT